MANGILCDNRLVTASGVTFTHSTEVSGYPAENVQVYQPGESFRTSVLTPGNINANGVNASIDIIAALYTNVTPHRNMLQQSNELDTTWTATNCVVTKDSVNSAAPGAGYSWRLADDATNDEHSINQGRSGGNLPASFNSGNYASDYLTLSAYVMDGAIDARLRIESATNVYMECSYDLGAGTAGAPAEDGSGVWGNGSAAIEEVTTTKGSNTWYRITLTAEVVSGSASAVKARIMMESGGSVSYVGGSGFLHVQGVMFENGAAATDWTATTTDYAGFARPQDGSALITGYAPMVSVSRVGEDFVHMVFYLSPDEAVADARISIYDSGNADGYIEIGNLVIAKSFQPTYNISNDWTIGWAEDGSSQRAPGGQLYRPVNKRYRNLSMKHEWLSETEAMDEAFEIDRRVGRSEGVLAVVDPASDYAHQWAVWGVQETLDGVTHRRWVPSLSTHVYAKEWNIVEALP